MRQRGTSSISVEEAEPEAESETLGVRKGSSRQRAKLRAEQDGEYAESLRADRAKMEYREQALTEELNKARKVEKIHTTRLSRVLDEPMVDEPRWLSVSATLTWAWSIVRSNPTRRWRQCTIGLARCSLFRCTSRYPAHQAM